MKVYRIAWTVAVGVLVARGVTLGLDHHPGLAGTALLLGAGAGAAWSAGGPPRRTAATALAAGTVPAAIVGHLPALGAGLVVVGFVVLVTSPGFLAALERWLGSPGESSRVDSIVRGLAHAAPGYVPPPPTDDLDRDDAGRTGTLLPPRGRS